MEIEFSAEQDIAAPAEYVFECAQDFAHFEELARARGVSVDRRGSSPQDGVSWTVSFNLRAMRREVELKLAEHEPPERMLLTFYGRSLERRSSVQIVPVDGGHARLRFEVSVAPRSLAARLILQSLALSRGRIERKLKARLQGFAQMVEARWAGGPPSPVSAAADPQDKPRARRALR